MKKTRAKMRQLNILGSFCKQIMIFLQNARGLEKNMVNIMVWLVFCLAISKNKMLVMNFMSKEVKIENYRLTTLKWDILRNWLLRENPPDFFKPYETEAKLFPHEVLHW